MKNFIGGYKMKIAFLAFPLGKVGGVFTTSGFLADGLEKLGHQVDKYFLTTNKKRKPEKNEFGYKNVLGFENEEWLEEYREVIKDYDLLLFVHACPHQLKSYTSTNWVECFNNDKPKMAYIRDNYFEKYYSWFRKIPNVYNVKIICPYQAQFDSIKSLTAMKKIIDNPNYPTEQGLHTELKEDIVVDHNNWKSCKHKEILLDRAHEINDAFKVISFGDPDTFDHRVIMKHKNYNLFEHRGWCEKPEIYEELKKAKVVVDMNYRSNVNTTFNNTIVEACAFGAIPITQMNIDTWNHPIFYWKTTKNKIVEHIKYLTKNFDKFEEERKKNLKYVQGIKPEIVAQKIIDYHNEPYKINMEGLDKWIK